MSDTQNSAEDDFGGAVPPEALELNSAVTESLTASGAPNGDKTKQSGSKD